PWEINPGKVLDAPGAGGQLEWVNLFRGRTGPTVWGKYGPGADPQPHGGTASAPRSPAPHFYAQVDFDASNNSSFPTVTPTARWTLPAVPLLFPAFPQGYDNGRPIPQGADPSNERKNHPSLYDAFNPYHSAASNPPRYDRRFAASNLE